VQTLCTSCLLNDGSYVDCPELPKKLNIDGREVSVSLINPFILFDIWWLWWIQQLFGRMMKGGGVFDDQILTAINKLRGDSNGYPCN
jgi:hypothetical protein